MSTFNTSTNTGTYTVIDIRRTYEGFEADLRMIARRTSKWDTAQVDRVIHDILKLAESKYISAVNILLQRDTDNYVLRATKYTVNQDGKAQSTQRPGENDWTNISATHLAIVVEYQPSWRAMSSDEQQRFRERNDFKINWSPSTVDTAFKHLSSQSAQLYASNGFELQKKNFK